MRCSALPTLFVVAMLAFVGSSPLYAERGWMQQGQIIDELTNVRLTGLYPTNVPWSEVINADGTTEYFEGSERRPGRWSVQGELYCFAYAMPHQGGCFRIVKHSPNCYELYTASIGNVSPMAPPPASAMAWNGRMWREAEPGTCGEKPMS